MSLDIYFKTSKGYDFNTYVSDCDIAVTFKGNQKGVLI